MGKLQVTLLLSVLGLSTLGCSSTPKTTAQSTSPQKLTSVAPKLSESQARAVDEAQKETGASGLSIDEQILKLCPSVTPPRFDYDSSKVRASFRAAIAGLAECMLSGGLQGRELLLVGHADPRGEEDYNLSLGGRRAASVRQALESFGVEDRRVDLTSRGALDATGNDESGWAKDRRVDIRLKM